MRERNKKYEASNGIKNMYVLVQCYIVQSKHTTCDTEQLTVKAETTKSHAVSNNSKSKCIEEISRKKSLRMCLKNDAKENRSE